MSLAPVALEGFQQLSPSLLSLPPSTPIHITQADGDQPSSSTCTQENGIVSTGGSTRVVADQQDTIEGGGVNNGNGQARIGGGAIDPREYISQQSASEGYAAGHEADEETSDRDQAADEENWMEEEAWDELQKQKFLDDPRNLQTAFLHPRGIQQLIAEHLKEATAAVDDADHEDPEAAWKLEVDDGRPHLVTGPLVCDPKESMRKLLSELNQMISPLAILAPYIGIELLEELPLQLFEACKRGVKLFIVCPLEIEKSDREDFILMQAVFSVLRKQGAEVYPVFSAVPYSRVAMPDVQIFADATTGRAVVGIAFVQVHYDARSKKSTFHDSIAMLSSTISEARIVMPDLAVYESWTEFCDEIYEEEITKSRSEEIKRRRGTTSSQERSIDEMRMSALPSSSEIEASVRKHREKEYAHVDADWIKRAETISKNIKAEFESITSSLPNAVETEMKKREIENKVNALYPLPIEEPKSAKAKKKKGGNK